MCSVRGRTRGRVLRLALLTLLVCVAWCAQAQAAAVQKTGYITTSDGVKLRYAVALPAAAGRFPVVMKYDGYCEGTAPLTCNEGQDASALLAAGYAVLGVNARGTGCSGGQFDFRSPGESRDGAAAVEWAARQPWSTGHLGMFGDSFPGLLQPGVAALHPAGLDAIAPWQIVDDLYRDAGYPGGIVNGEFAAFWGLGDQPAASNSSALQGIEGGDPQCAKNVAEHTAPNLASNIVVAGVQHPYFDSFWKSKAVGAAASRIAVPAFGCQTWQDDEVGSRSAWTLWPRLRAARTWVVAANGYHSMCVNSRPITNELVRFFDRFVKGRHNGFEKTPHMQIWHDTTGATEAKPTWVTTSSKWPPATDTNRLYLRSGAALRPKPPSGAKTDTYVSPTVSAGNEDGIVFGQGNKLWKVPGTPKGALAYTTPKLAHAAELLGPASVNLWLRSTTTDTNLQATISEVRPDGQEVYVGRGWLRASQRKLDRRASTTTMPVPTNLRSDVRSLVPGKPTFMRLNVFPLDYVLRRGSRIRLIIDTPSQTGGWNFEPVATAGVNSVLLDRKHPAEVVVGTAPLTKARAGYPACDTLLNQPCRPDAFTASGPPGWLDWPKASCVRALRHIRGAKVGPAVLGRSRKRQRRLIGARLKSGRGGIDRYCVAGGGRLRIGYPTRRLYRGVGRRLRRRIRGKAQLALTTSKHVAIKRIRVGSRVRTMRRRLRGERRYRVGHNVWYVARAKRARLVFKTRRGRVRELGLAGKRLTHTPHSTRHLLRAWRL